MPRPRPSGATFTSASISTPTIGVNQCACRSKAVVLERLPFFAGMAVAADVNCGMGFLESGPTRPANLAADAHSESPFCLLGALGCGAGAGLRVTVTS